MRLFKRFVIQGVVFALLVVGIFWGGTLLGKVTGHWQSTITAEDYRQLLGGR